MNIQPAKSDGVYAPAKPKSTPAKSAPQSEPAGELAIERNEKLMKALRNTPDVRPEEMERGKALVADPSYPSEEALAKLAELFVNDARRTR